MVVDGVGSYSTDDEGYVGFFVSVYTQIACSTLSSLSLLCTLDIIISCTHIVVAEVYLITEAANFTLRTSSNGVVVHMYLGQ